MLKHIEELEPEFNADNTIECTSFAFEGKTYTISTARLSGAPYPLFMSFVTALGDHFNDNSDLTDKDYETMLFIDGESNGSDVYPFGDMPGNETQGVFQRYDTVDEAREGHQKFVERVKQILLSKEQANA
jgi:hypothetical protein